MFYRIWTTKAAIIFARAMHSGSMTCKGCVGCVQNRERWANGAKFNCSYILKVNIMPHCAAFGCDFQSKSNKGSDVSLHCFPKEKKIRKEWEVACGRVQLPKDPRLCSRHFSPEAFEAFSRLKDRLPRYSPDLSLRCARVQTERAERQTCSSRYCQNLAS